jgi:holo-[acyl-carrier protein] synthase
MSILSVGLDLVDVDRVKKLLGRFGEKALDRLLTDEEREYCLAMAHPARHIAARVAAKEAAYKALSQGGTHRLFWWQDVEVKRDGQGRPSVIFHGRAKESADELGVSGVLISLTHADTHAAAVVILVG